MSCGVGRRHGLDLAWLWCRPAATAPIRPLAREPPFATGAALKKKKTKIHTHTQLPQTKLVFYGLILSSIKWDDFKLFLYKN